MILENTWETNHFKIKCGKLVLFQNQIFDFETILMDIEKEDYDFISIFNCGNNYIHNKSISRLNGATLLDLKTSLEYHGNKNLGYSGNFDCIKEWNTQSVDDLDNIQKLSKNLFNMTRFSKDDYLDFSKVQEMYEMWITNSLANGAKLYYVSINRIVVSFILISEYEEKIDIELLGTNSAFRGKGYASLLIKYVIDLNHNKKIRVVTQADNYTAMNFYQKNGFIIRNIDSIYHYHRK